MQNKSSSTNNYYSAKYRNKGLKKDHRFGAGFLCFAMAWMFFLGVWVGRDLFPIRFYSDQEQNVSFKKAYNNKSNNEIAKVTELDFYKALKQNDISLLKPDDLKKSKKNYFSYVKPETQIKAKKSPQKKVELKIEKNIFTAQNRNYGNKYFQNGENTFTLQLAAFKNPGSAVNLLDKLEQKGFPAYTSTINIPEKGIWYRVRVGRFKSMNVAKKVQNKLHNKSIDTIIVPFQVEGEYGYTIAKEKSSTPES